MKTFKEFIVEAKMSLNKSTIKELNTDLYDLVKSSDTFESTKDMIDSVIATLDDHDLTIVGKDNKTFSGRLIDNKETKEFNLALVSNVNDGKFIPYSNVKLSVDWDKTQDGINIKDCFVG